MGIRSLIGHQRVGVLGKVAFLASAIVGVSCPSCSSGADVPQLANTGPVSPESASASARISLAEAKEIAFRNNWDLLAAQSDVAVADAQRLIAKEFPNPSISASLSKINVDNHPNGTTAGNGFWDRSYDTVLAITQLFEVGGKRAARRASAQAGLEAASERLADARRVLDAAVTKAYVAAVLAQTNAGTLTESAALLRKEAALGQVRFRAGDISRSDLDRLEIAAAQDELAAKTAQAGAVANRIQVEQLLGVRNPSGSWTASDPLDALAGVTLTIRDRRQDRPDLLAARALLEKAQADLKLQKALRIPDPSVFLQYEHQPADAPNSIGIGVSIPLPLWSHNRGGIRAADAVVTQAERDIARVQAAIASELADARIAYEEAEARWRYSRDSLQPQSQRTRESVAFAFEKGGASLVDLLEAERSDNTVRLATQQAAADTATAAAALAAVLNSFDYDERKELVP